MRLGVYGGTFSPPHMGHILAARAFVQQMNIDKLLIIPTNIPPHKDYSSDVTAFDRLKMCSLAFSDVPHAEISDMEITRGGKSYTYVTLEELSDDTTEIFLLCGTDMILTFDAWKNFKRIFELATICYVRREDDSDTKFLIDNKVKQYRELYGAKIVQINNAALEVSSTQMREALANGCAAELIDKNTYSYICERGLYK